MGAAILDDVMIMVAADWSRGYIAVCDKLRMALIVFWNEGLYSTAYNNGGYCVLEKNECGTLNSRQMPSLWWHFFHFFKFGVYRVLELKSSFVLRTLIYTSGILLT